jgi:two-component system sensor histidine kinase KdpD
MLVPMEQVRRRPRGIAAPRVATGYALALGGTAVVTLALLALRGRVSTTSVALAYLLVVLATAANGGLGPGVAASALGSLAFDLLFLPPYGHLKVDGQQDYVSLGVYLSVALVVSLLVGARERRKAEAERREDETRTLYELSASLLGHDDLRATLLRVACTVRSLFDLDGCAILVLADADGGGFRLAASDGRVPEDLAGALAVDGGSVRLLRRPAAPAGGGAGPPGTTLLLPLRATERPVGAMVLVVERARSPGLEAADRRILSTFANQAALAVDRGRRDEERAHARALAETDRLRAALLNSVSHDLRTPLAAIKASASSLLDPDIAWEPEQRREFLDTIDQEADRLSRLVHNLLDMSRIEAGALDPRLTETTLSEVAGPVVRLARMETGQRIVVDLPDELPTILVDPVRLEQVLINLLDNARRHTDGEAVTLTGRRGDGAVELRVVDHGPGIPQAERERVFDQFYRLRRNGSGAGGTGMGLAICRGIVEALGGTIRVEATPGGGTTFVVSLPTADPGAERRAP